MREMPHGERVRLCTLAPLGDVGMILTAFWVVAWLGGGRRWLLRPTWAHVVGFTGLGLAMTLVFEHLATQVWSLWSYSEAMPVIPHPGGGPCATIDVERAAAVSHLVHAPAAKWASLASVWLAPTHGLTGVVTAAVVLNPLSTRLAHPDRARRSNPRASHR